VICCVTLKIPSVLPELQYTVAVQGTGGNSFNETRKVFVARKTLSIFVQTDKGMYKPSQPGTEILLFGVDVFESSDYVVQWHRPTDEVGGD